MKKVKQAIWAGGICLLAFFPLQAVPSAIAMSIPQVAGRAYMLPDATEGVRQPVINLNGRWDFKLDKYSGWKTIQVPGEAAMQGFGITHDRSFFYRKRFSLPKDFAGRRIILRFDGVYSHAKLSVNGFFVKEHHGGFTRWETDITRWVCAGKKVEIGLEVEDRIDDVSYAAGYAHHPIGGILRDVTLFALPESHLYDVYFETHLDSTYTDAYLRFACRFDDASVTVPDEVRFTVKDPEGRNVSLGNMSTFALKEGGNTIDLPMKRPVLWDAEHPNLYTVRVDLLSGGEGVSSFTRSVGFRDIKVIKDKMYVNGMQVKLRGACRHDVHPTMGRSTNRELDSLDVIRFKESNMNFVRTSHYPPSENFLEFCDRYGIYVESETAVCFVNTYRQKNFAPGASQDDSSFTERYLGQLQEMVKSHRSHASVLFWSIGNESVYGKNFQLSYDWVKANDTTRPVIFSYPGSAAKKKAKIYDLLSMHYQDVYGSLRQWGMQTRGFQGEGIPVIYDEWAHPACYTYSTLQVDPNIREFWGKSIDMMWSGLFDAPGGLGGAIWCYSDETFSLPEPKMGTAFWREFHHTAKPDGYRGKCVGYGEWGIVDVWRRDKPEFWATKKAYSPVRLLSEREIAFTSGQPIVLTVKNRFNHTNLDEITAFSIYQGRRKPLQLNAILPHDKGRVVLAPEEWKEGETVRIEFVDRQGHLLDAEELTLGKVRAGIPAPLKGTVLKTSEKEGYWLIQGEEFEIPFNKRTGLIEHATVGGEVVIDKGPFLNLYINLNHLTGAEVRKKARYYAINEADWVMSSMDMQQDKDEVIVRVKGTYKAAKADYRIRITACGEVYVTYLVDGVPNGYLRETGVFFHLPLSIERLDWNRRGYWSCYPEGAFASNRGSVSLYASRQAGYGQAPIQSWQSDTHEYYYLADRGVNCDKPLTRTAKGMKENIYNYTLTGANGHGFSVVSSNASAACRMNTRSDSKVILYVNNRWDYPEIAWGNYCKALEALPCYGEIKMQLK